MGLKTGVPSTVSLLRETPKPLADLITYLAKMSQMGKLKIRKGKIIVTYLKGTMERSDLRESGFGSVI